MFPEERLSDLTVVTVTQRTRNDMTSWSAQVEQERLEMLDQVSRSGSCRFSADGLGGVLSHRARTVSSHKRTRSVSQL